MPPRARPRPGAPVRQIDTKLASASRIAAAANISAAPKVAMAGPMSSRPERTMMTDKAATASANQARRADHRASGDIGSSRNGRRNISDFYPLQMPRSADHSAGDSIA